ncbi:hypothetical protein ACS0TY_001686 [Phlomoides rotata]
MSSSDDVAPTPDPYALLGFIRNPNGSITRVPDIFPTSPPSSHPADNLTPVLTKDIPVNPDHKTWARVYLPSSAPQSPTTKLPLIVYFHGGGFVVCSAASSMFQKFCCDIAHRIPAVMVSVEYRKAPEHRLPAAYDDCLEALHWIKATDEEWLIKYADLSRCFLMGTSAGGNIAYNAGLRAVVDQLTPLKIRGLILQAPFFSGVEWTPSEMRSVNDAVLNLRMNELMWELALPVGVDRDHSYSNPVRAPKYEVLDKVKREGWKVLVTIYRGDPLVDRVVEFVKMLKDKGVDVVEMIGNGGFHGSDLMDDYEATIFYGVLKNFILAF